MPPELIGAGGLLALLALLAVRAPVGLAMVLVGVGGVYCLSLVEDHVRFVPFLKQFKTLLWSTASNYELSVIPMFVLMGYISARTGLSRDLFAGIAALLGRRHGGLAHATVGACAGFGAVCGSSLVTATTMGRIALPELRRAGYEAGFSAGLLAAAGTLGILIPPSVVLVIYATIVEASIADMFRAALLPGLLAVLLFMLVIAWQLRRHERHADISAVDHASRMASLRRALPVTVIFVGLIVGLGFGLFTPTPAAAVGVFAVSAYALYMRRLDRQAMASSIFDTASTSAMLLFVIFGAEVLKVFFARSGLPLELSQWALATDISPFAILLALLVALIVLGCFMDSLSILLVVIPFLWPVLVEINGGADVAAQNAAFMLDNDQLRIWFGILCLIVVELGLITPPFGLNVFVIGKLADGVPLERIFRGVLPFLSVEMARILLIALFPVIVLYGTG